MTAPRTSCRSVALLLGVLAPLSASLAEDWSQFRGPRRDGISTETGLLRKWPAEGPRVLWSVPVCQGYAAAAIRGGRVYFNDYDEKASEWLLRCIGLEDGKEIWRFRESKRIRPNHGITRTVPAVDDRLVFSLDPKCVLHALDIRNGKEVWRKSLVSEFGARIPPWYAGQCPLLEEDRLILAPGGRMAMVALDSTTGRTIWEAPNTRKLPSSHSSVMPAELFGVKQYLHCTLRGVMSVSAEDGKELWFFPRKFNVAMVPSPLVLPGNRIFLTSCYSAGSTMVELRREGEQFVPREVFSLGEREWNSEVHTPVFYQDHIFAVGKEKRGLFTCLDRNGKIIWTSEGQASFGLGSFLLADGMFFILEGKTGKLRLLEANTREYRELASAQILEGHDVWAPPALSEGKLIIRDWSQMVCVEVGQAGATSSAGETKVGGGGQ